MNRSAWTITLSILFFINGDGCNAGWGKAGAAWSTFPPCKRPCMKWDALPSSEKMHWSHRVLACLTSIRFIFTSDTFIILQGGAVYTASETEWSSGAILKDQPNVVLHQVDIWSPRPSSQLNFESCRWRPRNRTYMCCMCLECENNAAREMATELWRHRSALQLWTKGRRGWKASLAVFALQQQHHRSLGMFCSR